MEVRNRVITIERHILEEQRKHSDATGEFSDLLRDLSLALKVIQREVRRAGIANILGLAGTENVHGDEVKKLDVLADDLIFRAMDHGGHLCVMASEEHEGLMMVPEKYPKGKYVLLYDPLDGSSNIDANVNTGTIFSIYTRISPSGNGTMEDCLQPGYKQIAAGYVLYGPSMVMVYSAGDGVHMFTYDPTIGEFLLALENIRIPSKGKIYSINEGNYHLWDEGMRKYVDYLKEIDPSTQRPYTGRYVGSMVADIHRTLLYGGIFMYPADARNKNGKLRLMYEANPMSFIVEQAGGLSSTGVKRILDIRPSEIHQRVPVICGSPEDVKMVEEFLAGKRP